MSEKAQARPVRPARGVSLLRREMVIPSALERTFEFFANAKNLDYITPRWVGFEILTKAPIAMGAGTLIDYRIRIRGIPIRWRTEIVEWNPPYGFVDLQLKGPYVMVASHAPVRGL